MQDNFFNRTRPLAARLGDYIAAGRPIITTELPEVAKALSECALLAKPNPKDFASKILTAIRDHDLRRELSKRARELAETKYCWKFRAKTLEKVYHQYL